MEKRGRSKEWAIAEWQKRTSDTTGMWKSGTDRDTGLPTCAMFTPGREVNFNEMVAGTLVQSGGGQEKAPSPQRIKELVASIIYLVSLHLAEAAVMSTLR